MVASEQALLTSKQLDILSINTIRTLAIDAVQKANSGHPGAPMALVLAGAMCLGASALGWQGVYVTAVSELAGQDAAGPPSGSASP